MSFRHLPAKRMVSGSTWATSNAMAPPARRERALISDSVNPMDRPAARTMALMADVISSPPDPWRRDHVR